MECIQMLLPKIIMIEYIFSQFKKFNADGIIANNVNNKERRNLLKKFSVQRFDSRFFLRVFKN